MNIYIDSENVSPSSYEKIRHYYLNLKLDILSIKVFNDWSLNTTCKWNKLCRIFSLDQVQCPKRKNSVDFSIIIHIMNDIHVDDLQVQKIRKILIVSSDTDFINITNEIRKTGRAVEVYSPYIENSMYYRQNHMYADDLCTMDTLLQNHNDNSTYDIYHKSTVTPSLDDASSEDTIQYDQALSHADKKTRRVIAKVFRWHNSNKRPFRKIPLNAYIDTYNTLVSKNLVEQNNLDFENEINAYDDCVLVTKDGFVQFVGNETLYKKYETFCPECVLDDLFTLFDYTHTTHNGMSMPEMCPCYGNSKYVSINDVLSSANVLIQKHILHTKRDILLEIMQNVISFQKYFKKHKTFFYPHFSIKNDFLIKHY